MYVTQFLRYRTICKHRFGMQPLQNPLLCDSSTSSSATPFITFLWKYFLANLFAAAVEVGAGCCVILANASGPGLGIPKSPVGSATLPPGLPPVPRPGGLKPPPLPCILLYRKHFSEKDPKSDFNQENEKLSSKTILSFTAKYFWGKHWGHAGSGPRLACGLWNVLKSYWLASEWVAHAGSGPCLSGANLTSVLWIQNRTDWHHFGGSKSVSISAKCKSELYFLSRKFQ